MWLCAVLWKRYGNLNLKFNKYRLRRDSDLSLFHTNPKSFSNDEPIISSKIGGVSLEMLIDPDAGHSMVDKETRKNVLNSIVNYKNNIKANH